MVKVSYAALPWLLDQYDAAALRRRARPGLRAAGADPGRRPPALAGRHGRGAGRAHDRVPAVPAVGGGGAAGRRIVSCRSPRSCRPWRAGTVDAGLVIHEARFTYPQYGLRALVDLGEWWEARHRPADPARRDPRPARRGRPGAAAEWIRASVRHAWADPAASAATTSWRTPQEMEPDVIDQHIGLYVNEFTATSARTGYARRRRPAADRAERPAAGAPRVPGPPRRAAATGSDFQLAGDRVHARRPSWRSSCPGNGPAAGRAGSSPRAA